MTNKFLRFLSFITALCVFMGVMPLVSVAYSAEETIQGEYNRYLPRKGIALCR